MGVKVSKGPAGIAAGLFGGADAKGAKAQTLAPGAKTAITPGDPMSRSMGQYGKGHSYLSAPMAASPIGVPTGAPGGPTQHQGVAQIRGGGGGVGKRPRSGGIANDKEQMPSLLGD